MLLAACGGSTPQAEVEGLRLSTRGGGYPTLTGYVVNRGETEISSADVFVTLYDENNQPMEDVLVQVRRVPAGDSARFQQNLDVQAGGAKLKFLGVN